MQFVAFPCVAVHRHSVRGVTKNKKTLRTANLLRLIYKMLSVPTLINRVLFFPILREVMYFDSSPLAKKLKNLHMRANARLSVYE